METFQAPCYKAAMLRRSLVLGSLGAIGAGSGGCSVSTRGPSAPQGAPAPSFTLQSHQGKEVSLDALAARGPVVVVFYRGHW